MGSLKTGGKGIDNEPKDVHEIECRNIVVDNFRGMVICADNGIILAENMIDDDEISFSTLVPLRVLERIKRERGAY